MAQRLPRETHPGTEGGGEFERVQWWDLKSLTELFRRMVLRSLREASAQRGAQRSMEGIQAEWEV